MDQTSSEEAAHVPFPLYHGSSTHYLERFRPGQPPSNWPYTVHALELYRRVWTELKLLGHVPDWWRERTLVQGSGHANWQHGQLYVTPSKISAVGFAGGGAAHGGELLQCCRDALDLLSGRDPGRAAELLHGAQDIRHFLEHTGLPILVEFGKVPVSGLSCERPSDDVGAQLAELADFDDKMRELMGQQKNFRLAPGCGVVAGVFELSIEDVGDPLSKFQLREIVDSDLWTRS